MKPVKELIAVPEEKKHLCVGCCFNNKEKSDGCEAPQYLSDRCAEDNSIYKVVPIDRLEDTETRVIELIKTRQKLGIKKYGTTLADNPLSLKEWLMHSIEEDLDGVNYKMRAIQELEKNEK